MAKDYIDKTPAMQDERALLAELIREQRNGNPIVTDSDISDQKNSIEKLRNDIREYFHILTSTT